MLQVTLSSGRRVLALLLLCLPVFATFALRASSEGAQSTAGSKGYVPSIYKPAPTPTATPSVPPPDHLNLVPYATGFETEVVVFIVNAGDERLFVGGQEGKIWITDGDGGRLPEPFMDISHLIDQDNWEEGMLGMVFHPDYANNGLFFVTYNHWDSGRIRLSRFQIAGDPNVADPSSEVVLLEISKPYHFGFSPVHNAGDMHFGPDGYLYVSVGDGGPDPHYKNDPRPGDPNNHGQRRDVLLGKMLRIDVNEGPGLAPDCGDNSGLGGHYTIPSDNPFVTASNVCDEIWAYGLRNPWRFSFDSLTGDLYIGDVGEWEQEEINFQPAGSTGGQNYGWHCWEGDYDHTAASHVGAYCDNATFTFPIFDYASDGNCSVIGGYVYRGALFPQLWGTYLFLDFNCNWSPIWGLKQDGAGQWHWTPMHLNAPDGRTFWSTFGQGHDGELYLSYWDGNLDPQTIYHIVAP